MKSPSRTILTTERRLVAGPALRKGSEAAYRGVVDGPGEPHIVRTELVGPDPGDVAAAGEAIACLAHLTDLHVTDAQSPARFEFVNRFARDPRYRELITMQRPQEMLNMQAVAAMVRAINGVEGGPLTGSAVRLAAMTGDAVDNTQRNELVNALALLSGGVVRPDSGAPGYDGVQRIDWPGMLHWKPDGPPGGDDFQRAYGFPRREGLLDAAVDEFDSEGLAMPWLRCWGNHEQVCQGVGVVTPALAAAMAGTRKPTSMPDGIDPGTAVETFVRAPDRFMTGAYREVAADAARRPIGRHELFEESYYVRDEGMVRFVVLDTVCDAGGADGSIGEDQLRWLERRLEEVHSRFRTRDGAVVPTRNDDRFVVILSHHGYDTLSNPHGERRAGALLETLLRFDNVVLWLNGHIHLNRVVPRPGRGRGQGFWEVTTSALVDWPCQARIVELYRTAGGALAVGCTMLDHDGGLEPDRGGLAGLHRELAANVPQNGFDSMRAGGAVDRNVLLLQPAPF